MNIIMDGFEEFLFRGGTFLNPDTRSEGFRGKAKIFQTPYRFSKNFQTPYQFSEKFQTPYNFRKIFQTPYIFRKNFQTP